MSAPIVHKYGDDCVGPTDANEQRSAKRVRMSCDTTDYGPSNGHSYGNMTIHTSAPVHLGDVIQYSTQDPPQLSSRRTEDIYNALLESLHFDRIDFRVNTVKKALLSTCQWLFDHPDFKKWHESRGSGQNAGFLWIKGKPGCGKSTLMKAALEWARKQAKKGRGRDAIVSYFFNARASASLEKSSLGLYREVVRHLLTSHPPFRTLFAEKFGSKDPGQFGENWTVDELQDFLYDAVESKEPFRLCLFIDALDEAEYETDVRGMISFLIQLSDRALAAGGSCILQICLSSRHYPHITIGRGLSLVVEEQIEHSQDIGTYIATQLICLDVPGIDELRTEILNKSAGIFLWVVLVVEILNKLDDVGAPLSDMRARLQTIPRGLNKLFEEILVKSDHGIEIGILFFQWMLFRMRPLEPAELFIAMEYSRSPHELSWISPDNLTAPPSDRLARIILNCSRGLVEVVDATPSRPGVVQFIHETVREFLLKENGLASIVPALAVNLAGISNEILRVACLRCTSTHKIPTAWEHYCEGSHKNNASLETFRADMRRKLPFLDYAISHLFDHAEQAQEHNISQEIFLRDYMDAEGRIFKSYQRWWNLLERYKSRKVTSDTTLTYFIAEQQYLNLLPVVLRLSNTVNTMCGRHSSALRMALSNQSPDVLRILLENGADINDHSYGAISGPRMATSKRSDRSLLTLVNYDADKDRALYFASLGGLQESVEKLIHLGADVNIKVGRESALYAASVHGHKEIAELLLKTGADVNAQGGDYGNALQAASSWGREEVAQLLIDNGADVNAQGGHYGNALQAASFIGQEKLVQLLLDKGADVNAQGGHHGNALNAATKAGDDEVVAILRWHGAK